MKPDKLPWNDPNVQPHGRNGTHYVAEYDDWDERNVTFFDIREYNSSSIENEDVLFSGSEQECEMWILEQQINEAKNEIARYQKWMEEKKKKLAELKGGKS